MSDTVNFNLGDTVFFVPNGEKRGVVTGIVYRPGRVIYLVTWDDFNERYHNECEICTEKPVIV